MTEVVVSDAKRDVLLRILQEADRCLAMEQINADAVRAMLVTAQALLCEMDSSQGEGAYTIVESSACKQIRGKYASVPTSVDDFLQRKREDLALENLG